MDIGIANLSKWGFGIRFICRVENKFVIGGLRVVESSGGGASFVFGLRTFWSGFEVGFFFGYFVIAFNDVLFRL